jgi:Domain of unknown function (DUF5666)
MKRFFLMFLAVLIVLATVPQASYAHVGAGGDSSRKADSDTIVIKGVVKSISGNIWVVGDTPIEVNASTSITGYPTIGSTVTIIVKRGDGDQLIAITIVLIITEGTPAATGTPTATSTATATATSSATPEGTEFPWTIIIIEGPVTEIIINIDTIIVYGMHIRLQHGDPILKKLKVGDWVRLKGHMDHDENNVIIIIVIIIIIIETPPIIITPPSGDGGGHHHDDD